MAWVKDLACLKKCGMSIAEMKEYLALCLEGERSIAQRQVTLARKSEELEEQMKALQESLGYIAWKQQFYENVLTGKIPFRSNLIRE